MKIGQYFLGGLAAVCVLVISVETRAAYTSNIQGVVSNVRVYDDGRVLIRLENQPAAHPVCRPDYFAIDSTLDPDIRAMLLSRVLVAKTSNETVNIGFDGQGDCAHSFLRVHEIGW